MVKDAADVGDPRYKFALDPIAEYLAADRKSGVEGKRGEFGGGRIIKKKKKKKQRNNRTETPLRRVQRPTVDACDCWQSAVVLQLDVLSVMPVYWSLFFFFFFKQKTAYEITR